MKRFLVILGLAILLAALSGTSMATTNYVSSAGGFYISYPDNWVQMDYNTVDYFLYNSRADSGTYHYEAVFADSAAVPFHTGSYLILSLESVPDMADYQIDSVLTDLSETLDRQIVYGKTSDFLAGNNHSVHCYDSSRGEITILDELAEGDVVVKHSLLVIKLYEQGVANFYFFSPDSTRTDNIALFEQILTSFSTENVDEAAPREQLKLADVDTDTDSFSYTYTVPPAILVIMIIIVATRFRRKKRSS